MRVVERDDDRFLLLEESDESSLVLDPDTGAERRLPTEELAAAGEASPSLLARTVPEPRRRILTAVHSERALGVLLVLDAAGPLAVRELLGRSDVCESDLHGLCGELRAAGLLEAVDVAGERGYATTDLASEGLSNLQ